MSDSSCDLRTASFHSSCVRFETVPLRIQVGGREFVDDDALSVPALLSAMAVEKAASSSACPSPADFAGAFERGDRTVCFTLSSQLSGTYHAACIAREMVLEEHPEKQICVIDSRAAAGAMVLLLLPMVRKILSFDYAGRYSYYNFGGITLELAAQTLRIGLLNFILIGMGLWFAAKRRLPALPCLAGVELLVSLVLFTRVQNTGSHQMLLFMPGWLLLFLVGSAALADGLKKHTAVKLCYWGFTMVFAVSVRCSPLTTVALPGFVVDHFPLKAVSEFVRLDKLTYDRTDAAQIQRVDDWIDAHCNAEKGEFAYMIPHDMLYNSDMFQYAALPDIQLQGKLAAGISIPGTHEFPVRFFEAKYVLTAEPLPQTFVSGGELSGRWNALFCAARDEHFTQAASFDMGNGTVFTVWERTEPADRAEVEYYLDAFAQEDALYPEMFSQVAEAWLAGHGL